MEAIMSELLTYLFKFVVMIVFATIGVFVGKKIRQNKNAKIAAEKKE